MPAACSFDVIIVGGGLAGLVAAIELSRAGLRVAVLEKKRYPFHKVCGEYVSNEVLDYLCSLGFDPHAHGAASISRLRLSTPSGKNVYAKLSIGGFGLSRYTMDDRLRELAMRCGAKIYEDTRVSDIRCGEGLCTALTADDREFRAPLIVGAWGKRDVLDKKLKRDFIGAHTGYLGVKYHIRTEYPVDEIGLDNFPGGYCGISKVEGDTYNLCYLYQRDFAGNFRTMRELEEEMLYTNPVLKRLFTQSDFLLPHPEVINEISFAPKGQVENHVLMCGDTAGLITPLCGNGMSMAIAGARLLTSLILGQGILPAARLLPEARRHLEDSYIKLWQRQFGRRLYWGRSLQGIFGQPRFSEIAIRSIHMLAPLERWLIRQTHGKRL